MNHHRTRLALGIISVAVVAALAACAAPVEEATTTTLTLAVGEGEVGSAGGNWDPAQGAGSRLVDSGVFDVLGAWNPRDETFENGLAESYEFSDDRTTLTLELREGVSFVDGEELTAAGVEKYFDALLASGGYVFNGDVAPYELDFVATGDLTIEIRANAPMYAPDLWHLMGMTPVLSPTAVDDPERAKAEPLGSGPYVVESAEPGVEFTLVRSPDHWNADAFPYDTIVLTVIDDPIARLNALKSGQVDAASITIELAPEAEASGMRLNEVLGFFKTLWIWDPADSTLPPLRDVRVRQAIAMAFDREAIAETIDLGFGDTSSQAFLPTQPEYVEGGDDRYPYDPDRARELLAEAGYPDGFDVVIPTYNDTKVVEPIVQQSLADIGIRVTYQQYADRTEWFISMGAGEHALILEPSQSPPYTLPLLTADYGTYGRPFAPNAEIDRLVAAIETGDPEESRAASQELGEKLLDEAWYIPVSWPPGLIASIPEVVLTTDPEGVTFPDYPVLREYQPAE